MTPYAKPEVGTLAADVDRGKLISTSILLGKN
jgi:hypothetical protein